MKTNALLKVVLTSLLFFGFSATYAQDANDDQADVWAIIEQEWDADEKGDRKWPDRLLTDDFSGWPKTSPAPRNKSSIKMWDRFGEQMGSMVAHELYPLSIVVHGDVAVAHYLYTSATKDSEGEIDVSNGRYTDVLIRTEDGWKFIAWHGGDD